MKTLIMATREEHLDQAHHAPVQYLKFWTIRRSCVKNQILTWAELSYFYSNNVNLCSCMDETVELL
jgi:hypothetical protein